MADNPDDAGADEELLRRLQHCLANFREGDFAECLACALDTVRNFGWSSELIIMVLACALRARGLKDAQRIVSGARLAIRADPWLQSLTELFVGSVDIGDVFAKTTNRTRRCEAYYCAGEFELSQKRIDNARSLFGKACALKVRALCDVLASMALRHLDGESRDTPDEEEADANPALPDNPEIDAIHGLLQAGDVRKAVARAKRFAASVDRKVQDPTVRAMYLHLLGSLLLQIREFEPAERLLAEAVKRKRALRPMPKESLAKSIHNWAAAKQMLGQLAMADRLYREELELTSDSMNIEEGVLTTRALVEVLQARKLPEAAKDAALEMIWRLLRISDTMIQRDARFSLAWTEKAVWLAEFALAPDSEEWPAILWSFGRALRLTDRLDEAQKQMERSLALCRPHQANHRIAALGGLGTIALDRGDEALAERYFRETIDEGQNVANAALVSAYFNLAQIVEERGQHDEAERLLRLVLARMDKHAHERHLPRRRVLGQLARVLLMGARYELAIEAGKAALAEAASPIEDPTTEIVLHRALGLAYRLSGRYPLAIQHLEQAVTLAIQRHHPELVLMQLDLGLAYMRVGRLSQADEISSRALQGIGEWRGDPSMRAMLLNQLATLREAAHDFRTAESMFEAAAKLVEDTGEHLDLLTGLLNNWGLSKQKQHDFLGAQQLFDRAIALDRRIAPRSPKLAMLLFNVANQYEQIASVGALEEELAETYFQKALNLYEESRDILLVHGEQRSLAYILQTLGLGWLKFRIGRYSEAETLLCDGLRLAKEIGAELSDVVSRARNRLAYLYATTGRRKLALETFGELHDQEQRLIDEVFSITSDATRLAYVSNMRGDLYAVLTLIAECLRDDPGVGRIAIEYVAHSKALATDAGACQRRLVAASADPNVKALEEEAHALHAEKASGSLAPAAEARLEFVEVELARVIFGDSRTRLHTGLEELLAALPVDAALVEVMWYRPLRFAARTRHGGTQTDPARYIALIVRHSDPTVRSIDLGDAAHLDELIRRWREQIVGSGDRLEARPELFAAGRDLHDALVEPLLGELRGVQCVFYCPDGALNLVPLEALESSEGSFVLHSLPVVYLSSARDLLRMNEPRLAEAGPPLVIGDPDYDLSESCDAHASAVFVRLPGSRKEAERVAAWLGVLPLLDRDASKSRLQTVRSPRVLHMATHGYFLESDEDDAAPMKRSGLALAGANRAAAIDDEFGDGRLAADDVAALDLAATELVVLSACETGVGIVHQGEGVFGMRRAFALAGARTLVMSLWTVPDEFTEQLMSRFYDHLARGVGRAQALRQARIELHDRVSHPLAWAGFICQGDESPLPPGKSI